MPMPVPGRMTPITGESAFTPETTVCRTAFQSVVEAMSHDPLRGTIRIEGDPGRIERREAHGTPRLLIGFQGHERVMDRLRIGRKCAKRGRVWIGGFDVGISDTDCHRIEVHSLRHGRCRCWGGRYPDCVTARQR